MSAYSVSFSVWLVWASAHSPILVTPRPKETHVLEQALEGCPTGNLATERPSDVCTGIHTADGVSATGDLHPTV